jgi:quercetin 2,3-dioxygenase
MSDMTRRDVVKVVAAAAVVATGCSKAPVAAVAEAKPTVDPVLKVVQLPSAGPWPTLDPFLFCVHHNDQYPAGNAQLGPDASLAGRRLGQDFGNKDGWSMYHGEAVPGFPRHPHRGFETVTVVRQGLVDHADSMGAAARYGDGDVQWLTAGDGINHAEMFPLLRRDAPNPTDFFQIWLNLPRADKRVKPYFSMFWRDQVPQVRHTDDAGRTAEITVVAGALSGVTVPSPPPNSWASRSDSDVAIWNIRLEAQARWTLPKAKAGTHRALYTVRGAPLAIGDRTIPVRHQAVLQADVDAMIQAGSEPTELLILQGRPIGEPVVQHGPFVMNTREEIAQAFQDYRRTQFGGWPWPSAAPVHGQDSHRFARHADGRTERPT